MKMVAAAKLRKAQDRIIQARPFTRKLQDVVGRLSSSNPSNPLFEKRDQIHKVLLIVVGSDRGLCGGFNNNLFKDVEKWVAETYDDKRKSGELQLVTIGKKATAHFGKRDYEVKKKFPGFFDHLDYDSTSDIMSAATQQFLNHDFDEVYIAFNEFKSVISQIRRVDKVLPIDPQAFSGDDASQAVIDYLYEPSSEAIVAQLLPLHLNMQLWKAVLESNAAEQGARMTAMDSATENAKELERDLKLKYNQARQSAITTEISEIVSGAQALEQS
jgi:F-type H+-transporting ATPase subunit gamma